MLYAHGGAVKANLDRQRQRVAELRAELEHAEWLLSLAEREAAGPAAGHLGIVVDRDQRLHRGGRVLDLSGTRTEWRVLCRLVDVGSEGATAMDIAEHLFEAYHQKIELQSIEDGIRKRWAPKLAVLGVEVERDRNGVYRIVEV